jgi:hypothetical protein
MYMGIPARITHVHAGYVNRDHMGDLLHEPPDCEETYGNERRSIVVAPSLVARGCHETAPSPLGPREAPQT